MIGNYIFALCHVHPTSQDVGLQLPCTSCPKCPTRGQANQRQNYGNYTVNLPSWFPTAEGCQVVFPAKHTKHAKKVCITPVACGTQGPHVGPVHAGEADGRVQRTAECPGRDGQKIIFRAVDGGAPARAKHGGFTGPIKFLSCVSREMVLGKSTV